MVWVPRLAHFACKTAQSLRAGQPLCYSSLFSKVFWFCHAPQFQRVQSTVFVNDNFKEFKTLNNRNAWVHLRVVWCPRHIFMFILFDKIKSIMLLSSNFQIMSHIPLLCHHPYSPPSVLSAFIPSFSLPSRVLSASALSRGLTSSRPFLTAMRFPLYLSVSVCHKLYILYRVTMVVSDYILLILFLKFFNVAQLSDVF